METSQPQTSPLDVAALNELAIERIARVCHEANRAFCFAHGDPSQVPWDDAPAWQREGAIEGVRKALWGATPEQLHESWSEAKRRDGWVYGPVKDADAKTHPCLVPYGDLPREQQLKDHLFGGVVQSLALMVIVTSDD